MPVITIRGQFGTEAAEIGELIANRLHIDYVDRKIIAAVAERLRSSSQGVADKEMPPSTLLGRIAEAMGNTYIGDSAYLGVYLPTWEIPPDDTRYLAGLQEVVKELARNENLVIQGRGSQFILKDLPGAFHVLIVAPLEMRVQRVRENLKLSEEEARSKIARHDKGSREFIKRYFRAEMENPVHYDLVINTEHLGVEEAAAIVIHALPLKGKKEGP